jgi:CheY-like chemotaxis protein
MSGRVLIAEDSAVLGQLLADALRAHGVADDVEAYKDGTSLLSAYKLHAQAQSAILLVILDVELGGAPNGLVVGRTIRALEKQLGAKHPAPILFFSAHDPSTATDAAVNDCFPARYVQKRQGDSPAGIAFEGARLLRQILKGE